MGDNWKAMEILLHLYSPPSYVCTRKTSFPYVVAYNHFCSKVLCIHICYVFIRMIYLSWELKTINLYKMSCSSEKIQNGMHNMASILQYQKLVICGNDKGMPAYLCIMLLRFVYNISHKICIYCYALYCCSCIISCGGFMWYIPHIYQGCFTDTGAIIW